jgi:hypothetical protein
VTHIGKKLALRAARRLRLFLGFPEVAVRIDQFGGALVHLGFQTILMLQQFLVSEFNFRQHLIERVN